MKELLPVMQSAACYAELAEIAGSWGEKEIEKGIWDRDSKQIDHMKFRGTFENTIAGGCPRHEHIKRIVERHQQSNLHMWRRHPIGEILCVPALRQDDILENLRTLANTPVAKHIWVKTIAIFNTDISQLIEIEDSKHSIATLSKQACPWVLQALLGRMRLNQLRGETRLDIEFERAIWEIFPACVAGSPHLYIAQHALTAALENFFKWEPFHSQRFPLEVLDNLMIIPRNNIASRIAIEAENAMKAGTVLPTADLVAYREGLANDALAANARRIESKKSEIEIWKPKVPLWQYQDTK